MKNMPFDLPGQFYKGNLHTHSSNSDGAHSPEEVMRRYREAGYDFLSLTEHFMEFFDYPISDTRHLRTDNFTPIIAVELHTGTIRTGREWHILAVGMPLDFAPTGKDETIHQLSQRAADAGAFIGICHPSWYGLTLEEGMEIDCAHSVEIYNHGSHVEMDRGIDVPFWDQMLNEGRKLSGYATDDAHLLTHDCFGGWMHVKSESRDPEALVEAMKAGHYYSSQGPEIHDMEIKGDELRITCSPAAHISIQGYGSLAKFELGNGLIEASFDITKFKEGYLRATVVDASGKHAWSNPVWFD
jgi:hypothetical protein